MRCWLADGLLAGATMPPTASCRRRPTTAAQPDNPLAPKPPHFPAKAKRVLHIFCTGAVSHLDTWDYKPELWKRNGQPMPGVEKLITFQGENGNLAQSPWKFKPRGQTGKYISDLLPHLAELCGRPVLHSLADVEDQYPRARRDVHEHGLHARRVSQHRRVGQLCTGDREPGPARLRGDSRPAGRPAARAGQLDQWVLAGRVSRDRVQRQPADQPPRAAAGDRARRRSGRPRLPPLAQR